MSFSLENLFVEHCQKLKRFFSGSASNDFIKLHLFIINVDEENSYVYLILEFNHSSDSHCIHTPSLQKNNNIYIYIQIKSVILSMNKVHDIAGKGEEEDNKHSCACQMKNDDDERNKMKALQENARSGKNSIQNTLTGNVFFFNAFYNILLDLKIFFRGTFFTFFF